MTFPNIDQTLNALYDLARAGQQRLQTASSIAASPGLKARMLLAASSHEAEAAALHKLLNIYRATPHDGITDALLADPLWSRPLHDLMGDAALLKNCAEEEARQSERFEEALRLDKLPPDVRDVLDNCKRGAEARQATFTAISV